MAIDQLTEQSLDHVVHVPIMTGIKPCHGSNVQSAYPLECSEIADWMGEVTAQKFARPVGQGTDPYLDLHPEEVVTYCAIAPLNGAMDPDCPRGRYVVFRQGNDDHIKSGDIVMAYVAVLDEKRDIKTEFTVIRRYEMLSDRRKLLVALRKGFPSWMDGWRRDYRGGDRYRTCGSSNAFQGCHAQRRTGAFYLQLGSLILRD